MLLSVGLLVATVEAFHVGSRARVCGAPVVGAVSREALTRRDAKKKDRMERENIDGYVPKTDWDAEMVKLNARQGQPEKRPEDVEVSAKNDLAPPFHA